VKAQSQKLPQSVQIALLAIGLLLFALIGYFAVVRPQSGKAKDVQAQIDQTQSDIDAARSLSLQAKRTPKIHVADLFRLTKAMPDQADMAGIVLELNHVAKASGISFDSITPAGATPVSGYQAVPITLVFEGNFYDLSDFLFRLRNLVDVRRGALDATGRLYAVDAITFAEGTDHFPDVRATLTVDAFVYGTGSAATTAPAATTTTGTTTTPGTTTSATTASGTTTTSTTSTTTTSAPPAAPPPASGATAAGAAG
jgi:hypothetical protein